MKDLLNSLWKPANTIKPEELIGKQTRSKLNKKPLIILEEWEKMKGVFKVKHAEHHGTFLLYKVEDIEFFDDSDEAVKEIFENYIPVSKDGREAESMTELFEINFLKEHDLFQINDMFRQLNKKIKETSNH